MKSFYRPIFVYAREAGFGTAKLELQVRADSPTSPLH